MSATPDHPPSRWLGLDLGGTNIKVALAERAGSDESAVEPPAGIATGPHRRPAARLAHAVRIVGQRQVAAGAANGPAAVMANLLDAATRAVADWGPVDAVGVGVPGLFDSVLGTIEFLPNLPGRWQGTPVTGPMGEALGVPAAIINDARAFTLAEATVGAAAGCQTVAAYVLGTGIGGGLVIDGRLHFGRHGRAGELAHSVVVPNGPRCGCGNHGCLEAVASSGALARLAGRSSADDVFRAAASGDERARAAIDTVTNHLGQAIAGVVTALVPDRVVVGGGVAEAGEALFGPLRAAVARHVTLVDPDWYTIVPASLGPYAGAIGAALWAAAPTGPSAPG